MPCLTEFKAWMRCAVGFLGGIALAVAGLQGFPESGEIPQVSAKLRWLRTTDEAVDTVFLGSSRVRRQISPEVFDAEAARAGHPLHSFNLGIDAMTLPELSRYADAVLQRKGLKYLVMDLNTVRRSFDPVLGEDSIRSVWWHDWQHTTWVWQDLARNPDPLPTNSPGSLSLASSHLRMMLAYYFRIGAGTDRLIGLMTTPDGRRDPEEENHGYHPELRSLTGAAQQTFLTRVTEMQTHPRDRLTDPVLDDIYRDLARRCEAKGIRIVFIMMPVVSSRRPPEPPEDVRSRHILLSFDDPEKFPALYAPENHYDDQHLNATGAEIFTRLLAEQICAQMP